MVQLHPGSLAEQDRYPMTKRIYVKPSLVKSAVTLQAIIAITSDVPA